MSTSKMSTPKIWSHQLILRLNVIIKKARNKMKYCMKNIYSQKQNPSGVVATCLRFLAIDVAKKV